MIPIFGKAGGSGGGGAGITPVAHVGLVPVGSTGGTTTPINTIGANLIAVAVTHYVPGGTISVSDSNANVYTLVRNQNDNNTISAIALYICLNPVVGASHTFTVSVSGGTAYPSMTVQAFSGVNTGIGADQINSAGVGQPGAITPGTANSLVISAASVNGTTSGQVFTVNSGFNIQDQTPFLSGQYFGNGSAYLIQGAAASVNPTWSYSGAQSMASLIVSFRAA